MRISVLPSFAQSGKPCVKLVLCHLALLRSLTPGCLGLDHGLKLDEGFVTRYYFRRRERMDRPVENRELQSAANHPQAVRRTGSLRSYPLHLLQKRCSIYLYVH